MSKEIDVAGLVERLREKRTHYFIGPLIDEAADALTAQAARIAELGRTFRTYEIDHDKTVDALDAAEAGNAVLVEVLKGIRKSLVMRSGEKFAFEVDLIDAALSNGDPK